jgi:AcrR family transcriptional regulator
VAASRRIGAEGSATRVVILDATEQLMLDEGYAAVSTRRVAGNAGLAPALVHYYFPTTDDLLLAVYRRASERNFERIAQALSSQQPLRALWALSTDTARTVLAAEFMAMSNHRKPIGAEIAHNIERSRSMQAEAISRLLKQHADTGLSAPVGLSFMMAGVSRALVMEKALGISAGHAEALALIESWLQRLEPQAPAQAAAAPSRRRRKAPAR